MRGYQGSVEGIEEVKEVHLGVALPFWPLKGPRIKNNDVGEGICRKWGVARAGRARSVAVNVDPNVQKDFLKNFQFFLEITRVLPARKNRISK